MIKIFTTSAFVIFGTMCCTAQQTENTNTPSTMAEKPASSTEMKIATPVQPNGMNRTIDTATSNNQLKMQSNPDRLQQNQMTPNNGTLQNPNTTLPNNGTMQNPNSTMPNNSTATPQGLSPSGTSKPVR